MKKKLIYIFIVLSIFCFACSNSQNKDGAVYDFITEKEIIFPVDNPQNGIPEPVMFDYAIIDKKETIIVPIQYQRLAFYDLATQKEYHSIPLSQKKLEKFDYINKDSIFLLYRSDFIDTTFTKLDTINLQIVNNNGKIKICEFQIEESETEWNKDDLLPIDPVDSRILYDKENLFVAPRKSTWGKIGTKDFIEDNNPVFMLYNLKTNKIKSSKSVKYPYTDKGIFYETRFPKFYTCLSSEKKPIFRFFYSSEIFEWDYEKDIIKSHSLKSRILDTIYPLKSEHSAPETINAIYTSIEYDPYNEVYFSSLFIFPYPSAMPYSVMIIADKNFKYLGEIIHPKIGSFPIYTKENIISYFCVRDTIRVVYKKLVKTNLNISNYIDSVKNEINKSYSKGEYAYKRFKGSKNPLISFLQSTKVKKKNEKDYVLLTIYESGACPYCKDLVKQIISQNNDVFAGLPFYLILSGSKDRVLAGSYETFEKLKFIQDTAGIAEQLAYKEGKYSMLNPRLTVVKDNKVVLDTIYDAFHIESDLIPNLIESLNLQEKK